MTRNIALIVAALTAASLFAADASAQLFGQRGLGQPLSQRPSTSAAKSTTSAAKSGTSATNAARAARASAAAGASFSASGAKSPAAEKRGSMVNENARFIRGNRKATDFVGAAKEEGRQFVGSQQAGAAAVEEIRSAVDELQVEMAPDANQTAGSVLPPRVPMNAPRLKVAFDLAFDVAAAAEGAAEGAVNSRLTGRLEKALPGGTSNRISVSVAGDAAILRGAVASERDRKLAELMLLFEPGIVRVRNQLQVRPAELPMPPPPAPNPAG